ncbi:MULTISPECIES: DUF5131 family protein [Mycolicibacterium]|jgi:protein gp37|uniref:Phage Gp37/Gp68 family protein n=3 Tax=Mycolicibacterium TaxID=1866885 RepID=A0AAE4VHQ9_MYCFO|nr:MULTISPECIES: phage Gp37/Gp68 family protein [Mycolicibacterium]KLI04536.1 hypothetical protein AA982_29570 [Mycolicibacterium senegalense]KLO53820.1 hypothetical protein ABW05_22360 [Mycolicibacterium senegalense]KMV16368.1 hypothetical protein ACT17_20605 [Mycolicibacterium conceptionense]MDV7194323.1 phage Gp37/Gp68 family protein [Mycolicibacterium fortuitum]MDV7294258.1 phage Gp37/Gp68 family protein [Mycolicibacterium fortuitum]
MSDKTGIEWTDATWNPVTGCTKVSAGCDHCYAETIAHRFTGSKAYPNGFQVTLRPERLDQPLRWKRPRRIFVNSMADLFHDDVPDEYIAQVFAVMAAAPHHTFQVLTKRHARMRSLLNSDGFLDAVTEADGREGYCATAGLTTYTWPLPNVWLGVSTENQKWANIRIPALLDTPAAVRFISAEPLIGEIGLNPLWLSPSIGCALWNGKPTAQDKAALNAIARAAVKKHDGTAAFVDWVIVGGESGQRARPMHLQWALSLRDQCVSAGVPFLFKQWGEWGPAPWKVQRQADEFTLDYKARAEATCATHAFTGGMYQDDDDQWHENFMKLGHQPWSLERDDDTPPCAQGMRKWGKKNAGRELDGRTWDQYPDTTAAVPA